MKFAAFSGVLIDHSLQEAMRLTKALGFDGIEIACREPHLSASTTLTMVKELRNLAIHELQLQIPVLAGYMGHFSTASDKECEQAFSDFQKILEYSAVLDAEMIRVSPGGPNAFMAHDYHYAKAAHWLNKCAEEAAKYHKKMILEIHNATITETVQSSLRLLDMISYPNVGMIHDAGNMYITDTDFGKDSVRELGKRLFHVHVKDEKRVSSLGEAGTFESVTKHGKEMFKHCRLGDGEADHQPLFDALCETGYRGWITLEPWFPEQPYIRLDFDLKQAKKMVSPIS